MRMSKDQLSRALAALRVHQDGSERHGYAHATVSAPVARDQSEYWVRVAPVPAPPLWPRPDATGEAWAALGGRVPMPEPLERAEWEEADDDGQVVTVRAQLFARIDTTAVSATPYLTRPPDVDDTWWRELRAATDTIADADAGPGMPPRMLRHYLRQADTTVAEDIPWTAQHCDLHWANLAGTTGTDLVLLDWEGYSRAPVGLDAATLLVYSLPAPDIAARVGEEFSDLLDTEHGRLVQIYAAMLVMTAIDAGHHPGLASHLRNHLRRLGV